MSNKQLFYPYLNVKFYWLTIDELINFVCHSYTYLPNSRCPIYIQRNDPVVYQFSDI